MCYLEHPTGCFREYAFTILSIVKHIPRTLAVFLPYHYFQYIVILATSLFQLYNFKLFFFACHYLLYIIISCILFHASHFLICHNFLCIIISDTLVFLYTIIILIMVVYVIIFIYYYFVYHYFSPKVDTLTHYYLLHNIIYRMRLYLIYFFSYYYFSYIIIFSTLFII